MKVSVIIVAYRNGKILTDSLDSLHQYNDLGSDLEVIVVDNSPEGDRVFFSVQESSFSDPQYIPAVNRGFGSGNNIGAKASSGEILCFMNPDIIYIEPIFGKVWQKFQDDPDLKLAGGKLLQQDLSEGFSFYYDYSSTLWLRTMDKVRNRQDRYIPKRMYTSGANLFVRRDAFFEAGMFDENIFMYYEEPDLLRRIRRTIPGAKNAYFPDVRMIHLESVTAPQGIESFRRGIESSVYYGNKYGLDVRKKLRFERFYLRLKRFAGQVSGKNATALKQMNDLIRVIEEEYGEYIR